MNNSDFFTHNTFDQYKGQWIAIANAKIVVAGTNAKEVYEKAKKQTKEKVILAKIPSHDTMLY